MSISKLPILGDPVPNRPHAVSVHLQTWNDVVKLGMGDSGILDVLKNGYPRSILHCSIQALSAICREKLQDEYDHQYILLFPNVTAARSCLNYVISRTEPDVNSGKIKLHAIEFGLPPGGDDGIKAGHVLYGVGYSEAASEVAAAFWRLTGTGISSRLAQKCLQYQGRLSTRNMAGCVIEHPKAETNSVYNTLRSRIAGLVERAPAEVPREKKVDKSDVFLYPSGMSAIYHLHKLLLQWRGNESAVLGFVYELTIKMMETYGPGSQFYGFGTESDLDKVEARLEHMAQNGRCMQAIWCECPSNPLLRTVNLRRVKKLAEKYDVVVVVDETIGSFANVDVLDVADIIVSSLTKSFNGFGDVLAGSVILNPNSMYYPDLRKGMSASYVNNLYVEDAIRLERNNRAFLSRAARLNETAIYLVDHLIQLVDDPTSPVSQIYYPSVCWSRDNYHHQMRPATLEFTPGYGGLFSVEFTDVPAAASFFDNLDVCKGPSFGTDVTIAQPYVQMVLQKEKQWAESNGLKETIVRVAVGLEDKDELLRCMAHAMVAATREWKSRQK